MAKLIVIEGLDGSGKATQARLLANYMIGKGIRVKQISFPDYSSPSSSLVKMYLNGEFGVHPGDVNAYAASTFYAVDRYASYKKEWGNGGNADVIIADRYTTSNAVHQCSKLPSEEWDKYLDWLFSFEYTLLGIPEPSFVVYLSVDLMVSQKLMKVRYEGADKRDIHEKDIEYLKNCQLAAQFCAEKLGWKIVSCMSNGEMRSINDIQLEIQKLVADLMQQ